MTAGGGAQKLLENHAGAESMRFVVLASKIKVRQAWDTLDVEGQPGVASGCGLGAWGCRSWCVWPQPPAYGRSLRLHASSQAHYGVDEDEEWWPGRVLGVHSQGAHTGLLTSTCSTTTASSSSNPNRNLDPNPNPNPNTNPNPNPNQASSSSSSRRGACGCRGPSRGRKPRGRRRRRPWRAPRRPR